MFENYDIHIITKTVNTVSDIAKDFVAYESTHENEGIVEIRIFDVEEGYLKVSSDIFEKSIGEKEAFRIIEKRINEYEKQRTVEGREQ